MMGRKKLSLGANDRARGVLLGMACGDALGAQVEFMKRGSFPRQFNLTGAGPHRLKPGQWTDDTAMALALAEHLLVDADTEDLMDRWVDWHMNGAYSCTGTCFDIGGRTSAALSLWRRKREFLSGDRTSKPFPEGNGALMRVAPVAIRYHRQSERIEAIARWQGGLTHGRTASWAAAAGAMAIEHFMLGNTPHEVHHNVHRRMEDRGMRDMWQMPTKDVRSGGHCLDTLEASLWCMMNSSTPGEAIEMAVMLGDDADTTAAVTGAMAGAYYGARALPPRWTEKVAWRARLEETADSLLVASGTKEL